MTRPCFPRSSRMAQPLHRSMRGLSLIELMIAIVLGMLVVAAAGAIFISNKQTYTATESLGRVQENSRVAFELMARDIREAAGNPCNSTIQPANILNSVSWWSNLWQGINGYDNGALTGSAAGTDALELVAATAGPYTVTKMNSSSATIQLNTAVNDLGQGDILLICDTGCATIFQDTGPPAGANSGQVNHNQGAVVTPGNTKKYLQCNAIDVTNHAYGADSLIVKMHAARWYVANNLAGGLSLYRASVVQGVQQAGQEIVEGVTDMQLTYLVLGGTAYVDSTAITDWTKVGAVRINLTLQGNDRVGTDGSKLSRTLSHVVTLRNRVL